MRRLTFIAAAAGVFLLGGGGGGGGGGAASAQGIDLFGDARLGLGYNIANDGGVRVDADGDAPDDLRAVSRVRFGVSMTGSTDSGITFGATIRADNASAGQGGTDGQRAGQVFVSGAWGTLTYGDTNGADEQWVGDVPGNYSLTGLTDINETRFISNGGSFGQGDGTSFAANPFARPTVRYDYDFESFGFSVSSNRDLSDIGVGLGYAADFGGGSWHVGAGYYKFDSFVSTGDPTLTVVDDPLTDGLLVVAGDPVETVVPDGEQWSVGLGAEYDTFAFGVTYMNVSSDTAGDGRIEADNLLVGGSFTVDAFSIGAFWGTVLDATGPEDLSVPDGDDGYGLTAQYDLGGGATVNAGLVSSYATSATDDDSVTIADFGIRMAF